MIKSAYSGDAIGVLLSALCVAHCLLSPFLVSAVAAMGSGFLASEITHRVLVLLLLATGMLAFIPGYRRHGKFSVVLLAVSGLLSLSFAAFVAGDLWGERAETWLTVLASGTLISAHLTNYRYGRLGAARVTPPLRIGKAQC